MFDERRIEGTESGDHLMPMATMRIMESEEKEKVGQIEWEEVGRTMLVEESLCRLETENRIELVVQLP